MIHLDIKPDNIFRVDNGTLKIGDFGIAVAVSLTPIVLCFILDPSFRYPSLHHCLLPLHSTPFFYYCTQLFSSTTTCSIHVPT